MRQQTEKKQHSNTKSAISRQVYKHQGS